MSSQAALAIYANGIEMTEDMKLAKHATSAQIIIMDTSGSKNILPIKLYNENEPRQYAAIGRVPAVAETVTAIVSDNGLII